MSRNPVSYLFQPKSIAVIGASNKSNRAGNKIIRNLLEGDFSGPIMPVTPKFPAVCGILAYKTIAQLPMVPDLAIIAVSAERLSAVLIELGQAGCKYATIMAAGINELPVIEQQNGTEQIRAIAKKYGIRLLGGSSLGMQLPHIGLNASLSHIEALPGKVAFISQSSSVATTMLDWANHNNIGFSHFISIGEAIDIDFSELLDYLGRDTKTQAILLYIDSIKDHRHFMSAARSAARSKPILVIKSGKTAQGAISVSHHSGGQSAGNDLVYDAAFRRAGMLRVNNLHELFAAFETLAHAKPLKGERLAIITNGGAPGIMAVDALISRGGKLAEIEPEIIAQLDKLLPRYWSRSNPADIAGDSTPERFSQAVELLLHSKNIDSLLIIHSPSAVDTGEEYAKKILAAITRLPKSNKINILTNWTGEQSAYAARRLLRQYGLPTYRTPEGAVGAFMHMVEYRRNQKLLQQTPKSISRHVQSDANLVRQLAQQHLANGITKLDIGQAQPILAAYGLSCIATRHAQDPQQARLIATEIGFPIALKIAAPQLAYKSDVGGVVLNLNNADDVENAATAMIERVKSFEPAVNITGLSLQKMAQTAGAQELRFAMHNDPVFGPILYIGEGGSEWDLTQDAAVALPPLNSELARYMVINALKNGKIKDRKALHALDINALSTIIAQLSYLIVDCPEIAALDINPMLVAGEHITLLDVSITLSHSDCDGASRLAIRPYPKEHEEYFSLRDGRAVLLRPIIAEDEQTHFEFNNSLSKEDRYKRFFGEVGQLSHEAMAKMTQIDFDREMAFIASYQDPAGQFHTLGVVRAITDPENHETEFAVVIRSELQGQGLGKKLMLKMIDYCRQRDTEIMVGITLPQNAGMVSLARKLGFKVKFDIEEGWVEMKLPLQKISKTNP